MDSQRTEYADSVVKPVTSWLGIYSEHYVSMTSDGLDAFLIILIFLAIASESKFTKGMMKLQL